MKKGKMVFLMALLMLFSYGGNIAYAEELEIRENKVAVASGGKIILGEALRVEKNEEILTSGVRILNESLREPRLLGVEYSSLLISKDDLNTLDGGFKLSLDWQINTGGSDIKAGDYFYLDWPSQIKLPSEKVLKTVDPTGKLRAERVEDSNKIKLVFNQGRVCQQPIVKGNLVFNNMDLFD